MIKKIISYISEKAYTNYVRMRLKNKNFSIISDDCWGGRMYMDLGISYTSPTVNLFIYSNCFVKLVKDLKGYMEKELVFIETSKYERANQSRAKLKKKYPLALLGDVEIHFLHSKDENDAMTKWNSRKQRINYDRLVYKISDSYLSDPKDLVEFENLPLKNKVIFVGQKYEGLRKYVLLKEFEKTGFVSDAFENKWIYRKHFDVVKWLNNFK